MTLGERSIIATLNVVMSSLIAYHVAKLAGAPSNAAAGLDLHVRLGDRIDLWQPLFTLHAGARGELEYAMQYVAARPRIVQAG